METDSKEARYQAAKRVTWVSASTNSGLALAKIIIGWLANSHALVADGIHSLSDLISDALVLIAAKIGKQVPDKEHPYGHHRIETMAALLIAIMLLSVAGFIVYESITHLLAGKTQTVHSSWVLATAALSMIANEGLFRYTLAAGKRWHSNLLITNAYHSRSDVYSSLIVFIAAGGVYFGINYLDAIGAILIALFILKMGIEMFASGIKELIDTAVDEETLQQITHCIRQTPGVVSIHQLRTRLHGGQVFVDVHIIVDPFISVSEGHHIGEQVHMRLIQQCKPITDVTVHIDPENDEINQPSINLPTRAKIMQQLQPYWQSLPAFAQIKKTNLHYLDGQLSIELLIPQSAVDNHQPAKLAELYQQSAASIKIISRVDIYLI